MYCEVATVSHYDKKKRPYPSFIPFFIIVRSNQSDYNRPNTDREIQAKVELMCIKEKKQGHTGKQQVSTTVVEHDPAWKNRLKKK